jgi:hypothetical protein
MKARASGQNTAQTMQDGSYRGLVGYGRERVQRGSIAIFGDCHMPRASEGRCLHLCCIGSTQPTGQRLRNAGRTAFLKRSRENPHARSLSARVAGTAADAGGKLARRGTDPSIIMAHASAALPVHSPYWNRLSLPQSKMQRSCRRVAHNQEGVSSMGE